MPRVFFFLLYRYIVTDCDSLEVMFKDQKFLDDMPEDAVAQALRAGKSFTYFHIIVEIKILL